jgi:very-short-patch-repair endonuclease
VSKKYSRTRIPPEQLGFARQLLSQQTSCEAYLWERISNRQLGGFKFRRQQGIGPYIADFICPQRNLILELDGNAHLDRAVYDQQRTEYLERLGYQVMRVANEDVRCDVDEVLERILAACMGNAPSPNLSPEKHGGEG